MKEEALKPKYNRLFIKTYTSFAAVITVFAVLLGVLYRRMYEEATVEQYEQQLIQKAQGISSRCSTYFKDRLSNEWWNYLQMLSELCLPLVKVGGYFLSMKAVDSEQEVNDAKNAIKTLGGQIEKVVDYAIPGTDVQHRLIFIKKIKETPKKYPRAFAKIKKNPL